jgi:hypothetical protein
MHSWTKNEVNLKQREHDLDPQVEELNRLQSADYP